jgi:predicted AlkP superfamily phosphohydrolase/phosphomutase
VGKGKTLLIGLDGATFTVLDPLMERGVLPYLRSLAEQGVRAPLRTIMPPLTPPAWTSLMTGKRPGEHGVFDFFQKETTESEYFHFATSHDVRSSTIWSLASEHGKRVVSLNFPLMFPPPAVDGYVVPGGWIPWRQLRLGCHPPGLFDRLKTLPTFEPRELALDMKLEAKGIEGCAPEEYAEWIKLHTRREQRWFEILRYLLAEDEDVELVAVMFDGPDKLQHLCWKYIDPAFQPLEPTAWEAEIVALCEEYFRKLDAIVRDVVELAGPDPTVVIASDHGFGPSWDVFYLNAWLEQEGYLFWVDDDSSSGADETPRVGFGQIARHVFELDWGRTVAYAGTPSSQGIHIVRQPPDADAPMSREAYERLTAEIADGLLQARHPITGRPLVTEVVTRHDTFAGPYEALAPDLSLVLEGGAAISILRSDALVRTHDEVKGNHRPEGVFLAHGPSIRAGAHLDELSIVDVAPLLLYCLDVPLPDDMSGRIPGQALEPGELDRRPARHVSAAVADPQLEARDDHVAYNAEDEEAIVSRLRALGYVE